MGRPRRGTLKRRPTKQGISYGVAFTYRGEEFYEHFGGEWEGWDEERAAEEQRFLMEKVNRGEWTSAKAESARGLATAAAPTFQVEASQWLHRRKVRAGGIRRKQRGRLGTKGFRNQSGTNAGTPAWFVQSWGIEQQKTPDYRGFCEAAEGTRTLDLLHGKQTL